FQTFAARRSNREVRLRRRARLELAFRNNALANDKPAVGRAGRRARRGREERGRGRVSRRAKMFITKRHLSRRTLLKAGGASIGLPLLSAMVPAGTALAQTAAARNPRMGF